MNDEAHDDETAESVLRPFEARELPPLPPIEPSKVVPEPPVVEEEHVDEPVAEAIIPPPPPVEALEDDPWSPDADGSTAERDLDDDDTAEIEAIEDPADDDARDALDGSTDSDTAADFDHDDGPNEIAAEAAGAPAETITLPRKPFLVGLGVLLGAVALLAVLWQSGGDGGDTTEVAQNPERIADDVVPGESDASPGDDDAEPVDNTDDGAAEALAEARAEIASLEFEVEALEERPAPALDGELLRRIVVGADAKFVSALPDSVAVVGAFGGVSLIDPDTNRVVANGNVANGATRVMRTDTSVWLTNYADNQLLRVDPQTNEIAATFPFPGPDGIEKDGNTIIVASFDGEFVARVDPGSGAILQQVDVGGTPTEVVSHVDHGLWAAVFDTGELVEIDRDSFEILRRVTVGQGPVGLYASRSYLWAANHDEGTIVKVDPETAEVVWTVSVGDGPTELVVNSGSVWVTVTDDGNLVQVSAANGSILSSTPLGGVSGGGGPTGISFADNTLWVAMQGEQSVVRIDLPS